MQLEEQWLLVAYVKHRVYYPFIATTQYMNVHSVCVHREELAQLYRETEAHRTKFPLAPTGDFSKELIPNPRLVPLTWGNSLYLLRGVSIC